MLSINSYLVVQYNTVRRRGRISVEVFPALAQIYCLKKDRESDSAGFCYQFYVLSTVSTGFLKEPKNYAVQITLMSEMISFLSIGQIDFLTSFILHEEVILFALFLAPSCNDGNKNQNETDVDCGGVCTTKCLATQSCLKNADCASKTCNSTSKTCNGTYCSILFCNSHTQTVAYAHTPSLKKV